MVATQTALRMVPLVRMLLELCEMHSSQRHLPYFISLSCIVESNNLSIGMPSRVGFGVKAHGNHRAELVHASVKKAGLVYIDDSPDAQILVKNA